jgi:hypothetical protein
MMMEAARSSETSVVNYFKRQYFPEDNSELHEYRMISIHLYDISVSDIISIYLWYRLQIVAHSLFITLVPSVEHRSSFEVS